MGVVAEPGPWRESSRADAASDAPRATIGRAVATIGIDLDGGVIAWSRAAERMFGWREAEVIGRRMPVIADEQWPRLRAMLAQIRRGDSIPDQEYRLRRRNGDELTAEVSVAPIRDAQARIVGSLALVTEMVAEPAATLATARMEAVGRLAGGVAHDFNNILTAIAGYAGLLASQLPADDPKQADVAEIRKATDRANRLTRQLLTFGRREALEPRVLDLNDVLGDVLPMLRQLIGSQIELIVNGEAQLDPVLADPVQMEQVLVNLVLNARDAMPTGGRLVVQTVSVALDDGFLDDHPGAHRGPHVRLSVEDTGAGMTPEVLNHIFEPYFTTKEPGRGTGLGLSTVYGIVKQSDGYIWAESEPGRGSTVSVYLPRHERP